MRFPQRLSYMGKALLSQNTILIFFQPSRAWDYTVKRRAQADCGYFPTQPALLPFESFASCVGPRLLSTLSVWGCRSRVAAAGRAGAALLSRWPWGWLGAEVGPLGVSCDGSGAVRGAWGCATSPLGHACLQRSQEQQPRHLQPQFQGKRSCPRWW